MDGPEAVEQEFNSKVPGLMAHGGYVPAVEDAIMPDMHPQIREMEAAMDLLVFR